MRDTGPGIAAAELESVFTKFWTGGGAGGTGLGLWIANAIVEAHRSKLSVESRVGDGTTFSFVLPFAGEARAGASARSPSPAS